MRDFRDAKTMAQSLREALSAKAFSVSHSESLELIAKAFGVHDWNELSAAIQSKRTEHVPPAYSSQVNALPILPLRDMVLFPGMTVPLFVGRAETKKAIDHAMANDNRMLVVTQRRAANDRPNSADLYSVGVVARIDKRFDLPDDGGVKILVRALERAHVGDVASASFLSAATTPLTSTEAADAGSIATATLVAFWRYRNATAKDAAYAHLPDVQGATALSDALAPLLLVSIAERQNLLETLDAKERLESIQFLMQREQQAS